ncbi:murein L,D-transpeptidase catalytic domain-containing protein [Halobacteriovorax sp. HLS]|uniref:murein L,D-transpeptidase catalytic domain-containing protein n=1 Tax=Halobacteriovorax sp. HLS TaxID=2234000 RepID=UPI000FD7111F|nr:murein L,D-transpeptidase catalytic domain family protein [Halobacteriovorax sp. HLS]
MLRILLLTLLLSSCVDEHFPRHSKLGEISREDIYEYQQAQLDLGSIQRETEFNHIPSSTEVNNYLNTQLSAKVSDCNREAPISMPAPKKSPDKLSLENRLRKNLLHLGGDSKSLTQALCFFNKHKDSTFQKKINGTYSGSTSINNKDYMVIQDFNLPSSKKRLFLLNMKTGEVETYFSAHGMGTKNGMNNSALNAQYFSNKSGTNLTPRGFMVSAERRDGLSSGWKWHMKFDGLEKDKNDNSRDRLVVFHQGVSKDGQRKIVWEGKANSNEQDPHLFQRSKSGSRKYENWAQGMTWGCTAVASEHAEEVYEKTKGGALFYNYTDHEKNASYDYCGEKPLTKKSL